MNNDPKNIVSNSGGTNLVDWVIEISPLTLTLDALYPHLTGELQIALEAFIHKSFSGDNIAKFVECPSGLFKILESVVYDDRDGFSYIYSWRTEYDYDGNDQDNYFDFWFVNIDSGLDSELLFWLKDGSEVMAKDVEVL